MKSFEFTGTGFEYFKIWIVNILFTVLTLGIYYPWAKVRNNRYLYANSSIEEKNFDYHATGKQLLYGYLIAIFFFIIYKILEIFFPIGSIILVVFFLFIIPWLIWRSMKFNLNVTSFNNIRFKFSGGIKESYIIFLAIPILSLIVFSSIIFLISLFKESTILISIGIILIFVFYIVATAYFNVVKTRFLIDYTSYGNSNFETNLNTPEFIKIMLKTILISILSFIIGGIIIGGIFYFIIDFTEITSLLNLYKTDPKSAMALIISTFLPIIVTLYFFMLAISIISFAYYITRQRAYIFENTNLDTEVKFFSTMKFFPYAFILITNLLLIILTFGFAYPWAKVRVAKYTLDNTTLKLENDFSGYFNEKNTKESALGEQISDTFDVGIDIPI